MLCIGDEQNLRINIINAFPLKLKYSFFTQSAVEKNSAKCFQEAMLVSLSAWKKKKNSLTGNESDKLIESYIAQPPIEQQFMSSSIVRQFITQVIITSCQFNLFLQLGVID